MSSAVPPPLPNPGSIQGSPPGIQRSAPPPPPPPPQTVPAAMPLTAPPPPPPSAAVKVPAASAGNRLGAAPPSVPAAAGPMLVAPTIQTTRAGGDGKRTTQEPRSGQWKGAPTANAPAGSASGKVADKEPIALPTRQDVLKAAPPWLVSLVVHLVLMLVLGLIVQAAEQGAMVLKLEWGAGAPQGDEELEMTEFSVDAAVPEAMEEAQDVVMATKPVDTSELVQDRLKELAQSMEARSNAAVPAMGAGISLPSGGMLSGRSGSAKDLLMGMFGSTKETEDAVQLGLKWLARQQRKDGSWSLRGPYRDGSAVGENETAATAMAMLAFLGAGHTHLDGTYKDQMNKAVRWLISQQDREGNLVRNAPGDQYLYSHAQATIALCELFAMTEDSALRGPAQKAINYCVVAQSSEGGWRYEPRLDADTSVTGWFVMALMSGKSARLEVPMSVLDQVSRFLDTVQHADGAAYGYQPLRPPSPSMTAEGLLSRMYLGWKRDNKSLQLGISTLLEQANFDYSDRNVYYWYYASQVMHHYGASPWSQWNERMREQLPAAQVKVGTDAGSWPPQGDAWGEHVGRIYTTCLSIYCLEVYYRHMPLYEDKAFERMEPTKERGGLRVIEKDKDK